MPTSLSFLNGHSLTAVLCLLFGIALGAFVTRKITLIREARLAVIPVALSALCIYLFTHSGHSALYGFVFDKEYGLPFILYGMLFGMMSYTLFLTFLIAKRERCFSTLKACLIFPFFPIYLPAFLVFGRDETAKTKKENQDKFSPLHACLSVLVVFGAAYCLSPHYDKGRLAFISERHGDVRALIPIHKEY